MSHTAFEISFVVTLVLYFVFVGDRTISYLGNNYPNLGDWTVSVVAFVCIGLALITSFFIALLHKWLTHE